MDGSPRIVDRREGLWIVYRKKSSSLDGPVYDDLVEEALCFGWIDSRVRRIGDDRVMQWFSPRRAGGLWSAVNKERIDRLVRAGRYDREPVRQRSTGPRPMARGHNLTRLLPLLFPPDLQAAFDATPDAGVAYEALSDSTKKQYLWRILSAKRPATRANRIEEAIRGLSPGGNRNSD